MDLDTMLMRKDLLRANFQNKFKQELKRKAKEQAVQVTQDLIQKRKKKTKVANDLRHNIYPQGDVQENLYSNQMFDIIDRHVPSPPISSGDSASLSLSDFFQRPVLIDTIDMPTNSKISVHLDVWNLWSSNPNVRAKLKSFAFFRGNMNVRCVISSTKFHYGNVLLSYQPFPMTNPSLRYYLDSGFDDSGLTDAYRAFNNYLSQSPDTSIIRIGQDNNIEMVLPFICPRTHLRLFNDDGLLITNAVPFEDFEDFGYLFISALNKLRAANEDFSDNVVMQVYCWVTDLELSNTTAVDMSIVPESGKPSKVIKKKNVSNINRKNKLNNSNPKPNSSFFTSSFSTFRDKVNNNSILKNISSAVMGSANDEYKDSGPISKISSAFSNTVSSLASVPYIGPIATATSIATGSLAKFTSWLGFSRPSNIEPLEVTKVLGYNNLAFVESKDTSVKLTADPKQGLSIASFGSEVDLDPMSLATIYSRESYFRSIFWTIHSPALNTDLGIFPVSPCIASIFADNHIQPTAMSFAASYFKYWRGTISFRFEVVASSFHRGRLLFIYEPAISYSSLILADATDLSQQYISVLDISENSDITINIDFNATTPFLLTNPGWIRSASGNYNSAVGLDPLSHAGMLYIRVLNELCSPSDVPNEGDTVEINCYVFSDSLELAGNNVTPPYSFITAESEETSLSNPQVVEPSAVRVDNLKVTLNSGVTEDDQVRNLYLYNFGEQIFSFRSLLKRSYLVNALTRVLTNPFKTIVIDHGIYPFMYNEHIPAPSILSAYVTPLFPTGQPRNATSNLFTYLCLAYLGCKGGYRYRVNVLSDTNVGSEVSFRPSSNVNYNVSDNFYETFPTATHVFGADRTVEYEIPYTNNELFSLSWSSFKTIPSFNHPLFRAARGGAQFTNTIINTATTVKLNLFSAAAEDFTFIRFNGANPVLEFIP